MRENPFGTNSSMSTYFDIWILSFPILRETGNPQIKLDNETIDFLKGIFGGE